MNPKSGRDSPAQTSESVSSCLLAPIQIVGFVVFAALALFIRFYDLGRTDLRSDELNFLNWSNRRTPLSEIWSNPPWMDQIPLSESIAILWAHAHPAPPTEASVRLPFAAFGWLTVLLCSLWLALRLGLGTAVLACAWMGLLPFHVYQSREAYYYVVAMFFATGLALTTMEWTLRLRSGRALHPWHYAVWVAWAWLACLAHMSVWIFAAVNAGV